MSRFSSWADYHGLDLRDFECDEDGNLVLTDSGYEKVYPPEEGWEGQDRDSYSDAQDRDSYEVDPRWEAENTEVYGG